MKHLWLIVTGALLFALAATSCHARAGWGAQPGAVAPMPVIEWRAQPSGWHHLYHYGQIKGAYHPDEGYRPWISYGNWGPATTCPVVPPVGQLAGDDDWKTHGVQQHKISDTLKVTRKGYEIGLDEAEYALLLAGATGQLIDDSTKPTMVVIGNAEDRKRTKDTIAGSDRIKAALKTWKVQYAAPDHWHLRDWPAKKTGTPWIVFLRPDKSDPKKADTVFELTALATGSTAEPDLFAAVTEATQRLDPNWKPPAPPTPKTPTPQPGPNVNPNNPLPNIDGGQVLPWAALAALLVLLWRRQQGAK